MPEHRSEKRVCFVQDIVRGDKNGPLGLQFVADAARDIALGEFAVHYHIDWTKEHVTKGNGLTPQTAGFWHALGIDQLLHGLTYLIIVAALVWAAS